MELIKLPASHYVSLIRNDEPFSFSRFGDGEVLVMFNHEFYRNFHTDRNAWIHDCGPAVKRIFENAYDYYHCYLDGTFWDKGPHRGTQFNEFLERTCPTLNLYYGEVWQELSFDGRITDLTSAINPYRPVLIGPPHLENVIHMEGITDMDHISVDLNNAYLQKNEVMRKIEEKIVEGRRFFGFSASVLSKVLIDELYEKYGKTKFFVDFGSVFDPYCGSLSRTGMKYHGFQKFQPFTKMVLGK